MTKRIFILGSTGSIGTSAIEVIEQLQILDGVDAWKVVGIAAGNNAALLAQQADALSVQATALVSGDSVHVAHSYNGINAAVELLKNHARKGDMVIASIVGFAGVVPVLTAIQMGCDIALANKEALVAAGQIVMREAQIAGVKILPVDSEHSAIFQCLSGKNVDSVRSIVLTASGGSLRDRTLDEINHATVEEVLSHPTWEMGAKVTVDSASLMNKALEIIEAHWLFAAQGNQIEAVIHRESLVHGLVEFIDGSMVAQLAPPNMKMPIQFALTYPHRSPAGQGGCNWETLSALHFEPIDPERFPAIGLAKDVIDRGGTAGAIMSAANEVAVEGFLKQSLPFGSIVRIVKKTLETVAVSSASSLEAVTAADREARTVAMELIASEAGKEFA
ncbi:MAG: 1-deoxy-D-xylulose-5-phosphate reductoisomerase [Planctomycetes bacterium]|nr:1-deoxy-D-xylulose-5-phosphate reductoisomerase [Planctomycetota bacterium]